MLTGNGRNGVVRAHGAAAGVLMLGLSAGGMLAQENSARSLPITEVTAFKDGHALVVRSGTVKTDGAGDVLLDELPRPLLGTFWASDLEDRAVLRAVTAKVVEETETVEPSNVPDLLTHNVGAEIEFLDVTNGLRRGVLRRVLQENGQRLALIEETVAGDENEYTRTAAVPVEQIRDLRFVGDTPTTTMERAVQRPRLSMDLEWEGAPAEEAGVSLMGVEHGLRWIPAYRVTILDGGRVRIELEATLVNDLADLADARVHLAVGVPSFAFAGQTDPMALVEQLAPLGQAYEPGRRAGREMSAGQMLSNSIMTQAAYGYDDGAEMSGAGGTSPEVGGGERAEDLYVFTVEHLSLERGARMVLPLASYEAPFETVYTLDLIASPPVQALQSFSTQMQRELAMSLDRPMARHVLRITNDNERGMPITTAPALVVKDGRTLAQGLLRYAAPGARADLEVGAAVDLSVTSEETETGREPNALTWGSNRFGRIDIGFLGCVTNRKGHGVTVEVSKLALGLSDGVGAGGEASAVNLLSETAFWTRSSWWQGYSWPWWWHGVNGATRYTWTLEIGPGERAEFDASWHYFWN